MLLMFFFLIRIILPWAASEQRNKVSTTPSTNKRYMHLLNWSLHCIGDHTLSASTLDGTVSPENKVVLIPPTTAVGKHLALLNLRIVCEPPLCTITCSAVHRTGARLCWLQLCKTTTRTRSNRSFLSSNCGCSKCKPEPKTMNPSNDEANKLKYLFACHQYPCGFYLHMGSCSHILCFSLTLE